MAIGLGTMDMPVPWVAEWEWFNWRFPRAVHAGDTIYARWTLTQKRPPARDASSSIVVWRVDVHTADGALCAEGEVGAKVRRKTTSARPHAGQAAAVATTASGAPRRRRRRRAGSNGQGAEGAPAVASVAVPAKPVKTAAPGTAAPKRRRRRRAPAASAERGAETATVTQPPAAPAMDGGA